MGTAPPPPGTAGFPRRQGSGYSRQKSASHNDIQGAAVGVETRQEGLVCASGQRDLRERERSPDGIGHRGKPGRCVGVGVGRVCAVQPRISDLEEAAPSPWLRARVWLRTAGFEPRACRSFGASNTSSVKWGNGGPVHRVA